MLELEDEGAEVPPVEEEGFEAEADVDELDVEGEGEEERDEEGEA